MSWTKIIIGVATPVLCVLAERLGGFLASLVKEEKVNPLDVATATKSAISADREGKLASKRSKANLDTGDW